MNPPLANPFQKPPPKGAPPRQWVISIRNSRTSQEYKIVLNDKQYSPETSAEFLNELRAKFELIASRSMGDL